MARATLSRKTTKWTFAPARYNPCGCLRVPGAEDAVKNDRTPLDRSHTAGGFLPRRQARAIAKGENGNRGADSGGQNSPGSTGGVVAWAHRLPGNRGAPERGESTPGKRARPETVHHCRAVLGRPGGVERTRDGGSGLHEAASRKRAPPASGTTGRRSRVERGPDRGARHP